MIPFAVFVGSFGLIALLSLVAVGLHRTAEISGEISRSDFENWPIFLEKSRGLAIIGGRGRDGHPARALVHNRLSERLS